MTTVSTLDHGLVAMLNTDGSVSLRALSFGHISTGQVVMTHHADHGGVTSAVFSPDASRSVLMFTHHACLYVFGNFIVMSGMGMFMFSFLVLDAFCMNVNVVYA